ncbi:MAG TPA: TorF family putative porin [Steroidobacteraceae bacterium]|nr:TorF family putative porin [Steroidobacteraceae bacterium]
MGALRSATLITSCLLPLLWPAASPAAVDAGGSLALTSDDIYRGVSQTCGHPAAQADVHVREVGASGWAAFAGVWGSTGISGSECGSAKELDAYAGYNVALSTDISTTLTYTRYAFPGGGYGNPHLQGERYDYDQLGTTWDVMDRLYLTASWTPDALRYERYDGSFHTEQDRGAFTCGLEWHQPLVSWLSLEAGGGYDRMADPFGTGYAFWSLGLTHVAGPLELDLAYFGTADRARYLFGPQRAGNRVSATVLWHF